MKLLLAAVLLAGTALTAPASAATVVGVNDIGFSGTTTIQGIVDPGPVAVPGLTGTLGLTYQGAVLNVNTGVQTWNFDYTVTNTSTIAGSRISAFGLATTPNIADASSTGLFNLALLDTNGFPNVGGASEIIEVCFSAGNNACSGGDGVDKGGTASGTFSLLFNAALTSLSLDAALFRFQEINAPGFATSGVGINPNVVINPTAVPIPAPVALFAAGMVGIGLLRRVTKRNRRVSTPVFEPSSNASA